MKDLTPAFKSHIKQGVTTLCTCIEIVRRDGKSFRFTDLDQPLTVANTTYTPYASYARSSVATSLELEVDQMEVQGILNSDYISRIDVVSGLFDYAEVRIFAVNYEAPDDGNVVLRVGRIGEITTSENGTFTAELRGLSQAYAYRIGESYSPECRAELGDKRCKLALSPGLWQPNEPYSKGQTVLGVINAASAYQNLSFVNGGFDVDGFVELERDLDGWTTYGATKGRWTVRQSDFYGGLGHDSYSAYGTDDGNIDLDEFNDPQHTVADIGMYQDIDLIDQGISHYSLDTGLCRVYSTVWMICVNGRESGARFRIYALDEADALIGTAAIYDTGQVKTQEDRWFQYIANNILIPPGTRKLRFDLFAHKRSSFEEGAGFDTITAAVNDPNGTYGSADQYGDVAFQAQNTGTSGATAPVWGNLIGSTYTDGTITWKAVKAWKRTTYVDSTESNGLIIHPTYVDEADGYYDGGLLNWETGRNAGRSQEIKIWESGALTLFERPFFLPEEGDRMVIYPGCDRMRSTCKDKFSNVLNFRGEPDVPGQDKYYATPNSTAS